jgi:MFS family permease
VPPVARRIVAARGLRGFVDGLVSVVLTIHLVGLGYSGAQVGAIVTGTLVGSAALTIAVGLVADRFETRRILLGATVLMVATGLGFAGVTAFWPLLVIAILGTLNPSAGDVTLFLPTEQAVIAAATPAPARPTVFAWYNLAGGFAGALGALAAGLPARAAVVFGERPGAGGPLAFVGYALAGLVLAGLYRGATFPPMPRRAQDATPLARSRAIVLRPTALFSLTRLGGGFVVQSLLVLWLAPLRSVRRHDRCRPVRDRALARAAPSRRASRRASASSAPWSTRTCLQTRCSSSPASCRTPARPWGAFSRARSSRRWTSRCGRPTS